MYVGNINLLCYLFLEDGLCPSTIRERAYWRFAGFSSHYTLFLGLGFCILPDQVLQSSCNNEGVAVTESSAFGL